MNFNRNKQQNGNFYISASATAGVDMYAFLLFKSIIQYSPYTPP